MANFNQLPNVFTSQPSFPAKPDTSWIKPKHLWLPNPFPMDVVGGAHCYIQGQNSTLGVGDSGNCIVGTFAVNNSYSGFSTLAGAAICDNLQEVTMFAVVEFASLVNAESCIIRCDQNLSPTSSSFALDVFPNTKTVRPLLTTTGNNGWNTNNDVVRNEITTNVPLVVMFRWYNSATLHFLDVCVAPIGGSTTWSHNVSSNVTGAICATSANSSVFCNTHLGGAAYVGNVNFPGNIYLAGILPYYITDNDARRLVNNPWSVFKYPDEYMIPSGVKKTFIPSHNISFYSQPQFPAKPISGSDVQVGLTSVIHFPSGNSVDAVSKCMLADTITSGTITKGISATTNSNIGPCSVKYYSGANSTRFEKPLLGNGDVTVLAIANPAASSADTGTMFRQTGSAGTIWFSGHSDEFEATNISGQVVLGLNQTSVNRSALKAAGASDGNWHVFVATKSGGAGTIYRDGTALSTTVVGTLTGAPATATDSSQVGGDSTSATYTLGGAGVALVATWNRALTKNEIIDLSQDPWKLFELPDDSSAFTASVGGNIFSVSFVEGLSGSDTISAIGTFGLSLTESSTSADTQSGTNLTTSSVTETGSGSEVASSVATFVCAISESGSGNEVSAYTTTYTGVVAESGTGSETVTSQANFVATSSESGAGSETITGQAAFVATRTDTGSAADTSSTTYTYVSTQTESGSGTDTTTSLAAFVGSIGESGAGTDIRTAQAAFVSTQTETGSAVDLSTFGGITLATQTESGSSADTQSALGVFVSTQTETGTGFDSTSVLAVFAGSVAESGSSSDSASTGSTTTSSQAETGSATDTNNSQATFLAARVEAGSATETATSLVNFVSTQTEAGSAVETPVGVATMSVSTIDSGAASDVASTGSQTSASNTETLSSADSASGVSNLFASSADSGSALDVASGVGIMTGSLSEAGSLSEVMVEQFTFYVNISEVRSAADSVSGLVNLFANIGESGSATDLSRLGTTILTSMAESAIFSDVFSYAYIKTKIVSVIDPVVVYRTSASSSSIVVRRSSGGYPTIRIRNR